MDIKSKEKRSENMAKIRSKNTKPELLIRSLLHRRGLRFRVNFNEIHGNPDLYFSKKRVAVFVHGCFWHRHNGCKISYMPKSNIEFWQRKFDANIKRDSWVQDALMSENIRILIIWECTVKHMMKDQAASDSYVASIIDFITNSNIAKMEL